MTGNHWIGFCVAVCLVLTPAYGQTHLETGVYGGLNFGSVHHYYDSVSTHVRVGALIGGSLEIVPSESLLSYEIGFQYIQKGAALDSAQLKTVHWKFNYFETSLLMRTAVRGKGFRPFGFFGPKFGLLAAATASRHINGATQNYDVRRGTRSVEISIDGGVGCAYTLGSDAILFVSVRYSLGLTDIDKSPGVWTSRDKQLIAGAKFLLK